MNTPTPPVPPRRRLQELLAIPERQQHYSRLKTLFRVIYIIPAYLMVIVTGILLYIAVIVSWFAILITAM